MNFDIPRVNAWKQVNKGELAGSLYATRNINFEKELGYAIPSEKLIVTTKETADILNEGEATDAPVTMTTSATENGAFFGKYLQSSGSVFPSRQLAVVKEGSSSSTSLTQSITVPSGSNQILIVHATCFGPTGVSTAGINTITFNGDALTNEFELDVGTGDDTDTSHSFWYIVAPSQTTADVVATWDSACQNKTLQIFVYENANQTTPFDAFDFYDSSGSGGDTTYTFTTLDNTGNDWATLLGFAVTSAGSHSISGTGSSTIFNATVGAMTYSTYEFIPPQVLQNPTDLATGFCKAQGTISSGTSTRWWTCAGTSVYQSSSENGDFDVDDSQTLPTTSGKTDTDIIAFNNKVYLVDDDNLWRRQSSAYTLISGSMTGQSSKLVQFGDRLYIAGTNKIYSMSTNEVVATSGAHTLDFANSQDFDNHSLSCIRATSQGIWFATTNSKGGRAKVAFWDGVTEDTIEFYKELESGMAMAMSIKDDVPYVLDNRLVLMAFNGSYMQEVARMDNGRRKLYRFDIASNNDRWIHHNGMQTINDEILMAINSRTEDANDDQSIKFPSGVYAYNPEIGIYHKFSFTSQGNGDTPLDQGQVEVVEVGALFSLFDDEQNNAMTDQSDFFVAYAYKEDNSTTKYVIAKHDARGLDHVEPEAGVIVTTKLNATNVQDIWNKVYVFTKPLANATDKIVLKYRKQVYTPTEVDITWVDTTSFTTTDANLADIKTAFEAGADYEVEGLQGDGAGYLAHVTDITESAGTYTVTLDETITGATTRTAKVRFDRWNKVGEFTDSQAQESFHEFNPEAVGTWVQFKIYMIGDGIQLERFLTQSENTQ